MSEYLPYILILWACVVLFATLHMLITTFYGLSKLRCLGSVAPLLVDDPGGMPYVSVIIPACNEAAHLEATVLSLLAQEYERLELIVINDRSVDGTGALVDRLSALHPEVKGIHIDTLEDGWLGKNHAMHVGASHAAGEYLLFTDADIRFEPTTISRAMNHVTANGLEHLTLLFRNTAPGGLLNAVITEAMLGLLLLFRPWKVGDRGSKYFIGIGAFNLVLKDSYIRIGGHGANPLHPIDDIILGKSLHKAGCAQDCLRGQRFISVDWYSGTGDMVGGLMKNVFAFYNYHLPTGIGACLVIILVSIFPYITTLFGHGPAQAVCSGVVMLKLCCLSAVCLTIRAPVYSLVFAPIAPFVLLFISIRAMAVTLLHNGIEWRGTRYPLTRLRTIEPIITFSWLLRR